jgi:hypothetical protein
MFQNLTQGAIVTILYKNVPRVVDGRVISVNTHMPTYNPQQPMSFMGGPVTDITVQVDNETIPFAGLPASGVVANFPDKSMFLSTDRSAVLREVEVNKSALKQDLDQVPDKQRLYSSYEKLSMDLNPDLKKEAEHARELADMRNEMAEIKRMLASSLGTRQKEEL